MEIKVQYCHKGYNNITNNGCIVKRREKIKKMSCQHNITTTKDIKQHRWSHYHLLAAMLVIGCVELNPGPTSQNSNRIKYEKTAHAKPTGPNYEWKLACLIFLRQVTKDEPFFLATNIKKAGKFDDIVLLIPGKLAMFVQLKHIENRSLKPENFCSIYGDFSFLKFYRTYCEIKSLSSTDAEFKECGAFKNFQFVLYTNADYYDKPKCKLNSNGGILHSSGQWFLASEYSNPVLKDQFEEWKKFVDILYQMIHHINNNEEHIALQKIQVFQTKNQEMQNVIDSLKKNPSKAEKVLKDFSDTANFSHYDDFLAQLKIYIKQAHESCLDSLIKAEIKNIFGTKDMDTNIINTIIQEKMLRWWSKGSYYLQASESFWSEIVQDRLKNLCFDSLNELSSLNVTFEETHLNDLADSIKNRQLIHVMPAQSGTILSCLKVYQSLEKLNLSQKTIVMKFAALANRVDEALCMLQTKWCDILVIESDSGLSENFDILFTKIANCINQNVNIQNKKLITLGNIEFYTKLQSYLNSKLECDSSCLAQCTVNSQNDLLQQMIAFQGKQVPLSELLSLNPNLTNSIHNDIFSYVINKKSFKLGEQLPSGIKYYRPRTLLRRIHINQSNLKSCIVSGNTQVVFAISGMDYTEFQKYVPSVTIKYADSNTFFPDNEPKKVYSINENSSDFDILCKHHTSCSVHWFHLERGRGKIVDDRLVWRQSKRDMKIVKQNLDAEKWWNDEPNKISDINDRVSLIVAKPGMGKTTLLTHLAAAEKDINPHFWIVTINLNNYGDVFRNYKNQNIVVNTNTVISFLEDQVVGTKDDSDTQFLKMVFRENIMNKGNVIVLLDGYDEISPDFTDIISNMAKVLIDQTKIFKLWVTTRPNKGNKLEEELCTLAYTLKPFGREDQCIFLQEIWRHRIENLSEDILVSFVTKLLTLAERSFREKDRDLTGIPLQTKILAEVFEEYLVKSKELPTALNMPELYNCFMKKQFERFFSKWELKAKQIGTDVVCDSHKDFLIESHKMCGVMVKFPAESLKNLKGFKHPQKFLDYVMNDKERTGIIDGIFEDGKPQFTHQTYAEYYCALWLSENYEQNQSLLQQYIFSQDFEVVRNMLDHMLAKGHPLHSSVLNGDLEEVEKYIENAQCLDKGKRTALHLAAGCDKAGKNHLGKMDYSLAYTIYTNTEDETDLDRIALLLLQHGSDVNAVDRVLGWTPLQYANHTPGGASFRMMGMLLEFGAEDNDNTLIQSEQLHNMKYIQENIRIAVEKGYLKFIKWLLRSQLLEPNLKIPCENNRYSDTTTVMHLATENRNIEIMKLLLDHEADINNMDSKGNTALHIASQNGNQIAMEFLIANKASLDIQNQKGDTPLHLAASNGELEAVIFLLKNEANYKAENSLKMTPLHTAAIRGSLEVLKYLYENCNTNSKNTFVLHDAVRMNNLNVVEYLANKVDNINCQNRDGKPPLHLALLQKNQDILESLVEAGADLNSRDSSEETPIYAAIETCDTKIIEYLVSKGVNFGVQNINGETPLHRAVELCDISIVKFVASKCSDVNVTNNNGETPLMKAVARGILEIVKYLIQKENAKTSHKDKNNNSLLHYAAKKGHCDIMEYLVPLFKLTCTMQSLNKEGEMPMMTAAVNGKWKLVQLLHNKFDIKLYVKKQNGDTLLHVAVEQNNQEATCWLLQNRYFNVKKTRNRQGQTVLHTAAKFKKLDMLQCLMRYCKSDILPKDFEGNSPLHYACTSNAATTEFLLKISNNMEINHWNKARETPLHKAVERVECTGIISLLLENGAISALPNEKGETPLVLAIEVGQTMTVVELLASHSAKQTGIPSLDLDLALHYAVWSGHWNCVFYLLKVGANENIHNEHGLYLVHRAAERGEYDAMLWLLGNHYKENVNMADNCGITPLHYAAFRGHFDIVHVLLSRGANINIQDIFGNTALHCAARSGHTWLTSYLVTRGADIHVANARNKKPEHVAGNNDVKRYFFILRSQRRQLSQRWSTPNYSNRHT